MQAAVSVELQTIPVLNLVSAGANPPGDQESWRRPQPIPTPERKTAPAPALPSPLASPEASGPKGEAPLGANRLRQAPFFKMYVEPLYSSQAQRANVEGTVILQVDIDATGAVQKVELIQGLGFGLDEAAIEALRKSVIAPALMESGPVASRIRIPYRFDLRGSLRLND